MYLARKILVMQVYFKLGRECILGVVGCQSTNQVVCTPSNW